MFGRNKRRSEKTGGDTAGTAPAGGGGNANGGTSAGGSAGNGAGGSTMDYVGFRYSDPQQAPNASDANRAYGISAKERVHMAIFGLPGSGKSSILKLLALQNIRRSEGFMVIDPHGSLARDIMTMIPRERYKDVIYVNPANLYRYGRTVQINPLEIKSENERYVVVMSFVNTLYNLYKDSWGPRLETVLRNAANALVESKQHNRLSNMSAMITDAAARSEILDDVASSNVRHFWEEIFEKQYSKDAGSAAYNKMDKILSTPTVSAMFDTDKSSISMQDIMSRNLMLIVDLSTGASDDIAQFLGSIFLNMLYVDAKKRLDIEGSQGAPGRFYVYVDEAHMFSNSTMSEMLRSLRKFGVRMTLATQTCNAYEKEFSMEIPGVCKTIMTGRCDYNTANLLRAVMSLPPDEMQRLPAHTFCMYSDEGGVNANAIFRSRPVPLPGTEANPDWTQAAAESVNTWGRAIALEKYLPQSGKWKPLFTPLEACIIHNMHFDLRDYTRQNIIDRVAVTFPDILQRHVTAGIERLTRERYLAVRYPETDDGDERDSTRRYTLGRRAISTYLSREYGGRRAGGDDHIDMITTIAAANMQRHRYCIPDLGHSSKEAPDLLIIEPATIQDKFGNLKLDPFKWNLKNTLAVEVETDPTKHMDNAVGNYVKNAEAGHKVWFVCFRGDHAEKLDAAIREKHPGAEYSIDVATPGHVRDVPENLPGTYNELLTDVKVRTIRATNTECNAADMDAGETLKSQTDPRLLRIQNETARRQAAGARVSGGGVMQYTGMQKGAGVKKGADMQNNTNVPETKVENVDKKGKSGSESSAGMQNAPDVEPPAGNADDPGPGLPQAAQNTQPAARAADTPPASDASPESGHPESRPAMPPPTRNYNLDDMPDGPAAGNAIPPAIPAPAQAPKSPTAQPPPVRETNTEGVRQYSRRIEDAFVGTAGDDYSGTGGTPDTASRVNADTDNDADIDNDNDADIDNTDMGLSDLEWRIYNGVETYRISEYNLKKIRLALGGRDTISDIRDAVKRLHHAGWLAYGSTTVRKKTGSLDGTGDKAVRKRVTVLTLAGLARRRRGNASGKDAADIDTADIDTAAPGDGDNDDHESAETDGAISRNYWRNRA